MFDSGVKVSDLIGQIKNEADISIQIPDESFVLWLNALEQLLYTEIIHEQGKIELDSPFDNVIDVSTLNVPNGENVIRFEDIYTIYAGTKQLIQSTVASGVIFPNTYYKIGGDIGLNILHKPSQLKIIYFVKPELKTVANISTKNVMVPVEFIELVSAKLRGDAYKIANEDEIAAKWMSDYNVLLETFKAWLAGKQPEFGM